MKRSEVNKYIKSSIAFLEENNFKLPPWGLWTKSDWLKHKDSCEEIFINKLGWDITDYGSGDFTKIGFVKFTIRNSAFKGYCEKIMIMEDEQVCPSHYHVNKVEDIINRGGKDLAFQLYSNDGKGEYSDKPLDISFDGVLKVVKSGEVFSIKPGESICIVSGVYHSFWTEGKKGKVLIGEVSRVNDDCGDSKFKSPVERFPELEEDEEPFALLVSDYQKMLSI